MAKLHNHYEAAFEAYLRSRRLAYVAVDERRRAVEPAGTLKSVDYIVSPADPHAPRWLVDVKGRRFPSGQRRPRYWRNWTSEEELDSLVEWERRFGFGFESVLVFAYELVADRAPTPPEEVYYWRGRPYAFVAVRAGDYRRAARRLSRRWRTVTVPAPEFRRLATPVAAALAGEAALVGSLAD
ncbi:HYExAFE family protein [Botrimarina sp.]|uniref:HYExAFE family protein n=1 Tax=Botrimarina sp. TaxID=2795802 RepID=UPI0032EDE60B